MQNSAYLDGYDDGYFDAMAGLDYADSEGRSIAYDDGYQDGYADGLGPVYDEWDDDEY